MIQRIQTLWLLAAAICEAFTFKFSFYSGNKLNSDNTQAFEKMVASSNFPIMILTALVVGGSLIIIFFYKNRKKQLWLTLGAVGISVLNIVLYLSQIKTFVPKEGNYDLTALLSLAVPLLLIMAARGIWKDEKLVKSLDRLR